MFDPVEFIRFAKQMSTGTKDEKIARTCIGRAYYAAYLSARETVRRYYPGALAGGRLGDQHQIVRDKLVERGKMNISSKLLELAKKRNRADYDLANYSSEKAQMLEAGNAILLCDNILTLLQKV